jgi:hypothetical protein
MDPKSNGMQDGSGDQPGEGNYDAARRYRKGLEESVQKGDADELAEKARKALENPEEGDELRDAEERGKQGETGHGAHKNVPK